MSKKKKCELCDGEFDYQCGEFSNHLKSEHVITREEYVILTEYNNVKPKCKCGYCEDDAKFIKRKNEFHNINPEHRKFDWIEEQYILKFREPKCEKCGESVNFNRGVPYTYCSKKCKPSSWNQKKVKQTVRENYGVDNVMDIPRVREKQSESITKTWSNKKGSILKKSRKTRLDRHGDENFNNPERKKKTCLEIYGVDSFSKTDEFREIASKTAIKTNEYNKFTPIERYEDTDLYYQGSYEKRFLNYCRSKGVIDQVENSKAFKYLEEDRFAGIRHIPDFKFGDNYIIEIKSTYIMELQGGKKVIEAKKRAVESTGMKYLLVIDSNFSKFDETFEL